MKTANPSRAEISRTESAQPKSSSTTDSLSSTTIKQTAKTRNFGWLVKGMVEACHQINNSDRD
ncbi:hypothetical protein IQ255_01775 [Pleurocapsales cyanobacterium LEGE 10410]|nr:hypothetical protein [Pleurocapsales cyanobacterium LEGE 10410]